MNELSTDYLIVGAGATGASFADTLLSHTAHEMVLVDRRHQPGGHWVDAYQFVQLHQPSAYYGVNSLPLGEDRIDTTGINAGFYERAAGVEIKHYYQRVLEEVFVPSGRLQFHGSSDYLGEEDGVHLIRANLSGRITRVRVRRALVDARLMASQIPSRHTPAYSIAEGVQLLTPNQLVDVIDAQGYTIVGGGKTGMDVGFWLMQQGVAPNEICWIRPQESWMTERTYTQPLSLAANMVKSQAAIMRSAASASSAIDYGERVEAEGISLRIDPSLPATMHRGATISLPELHALREIEQVVRKGHVQHIGQHKLTLATGEVATNPGRVYVDCTAQGLSTAGAVQIFSTSKITIHATTLGVTPWSAAVVGFVETLDLTEDEKNALCPALPRTGEIHGSMEIMRLGMPAEMARRKVSEIVTWSASSRLNPGRGIADHMNEPEVQALFGEIMQNYQPAMENLARLSEQDN
ncbi:MAG: FAD/NAD(P)-binding protein [Pseudomonadota bacterium]